MSLDPGKPMTSLAKRKRVKIGIACQPCRSKKVKCDGMRPACGNCQKREQLRRVCTYSSEASDVDSATIRPTLLTSDMHVGDENDRWLNSEGRQTILSRKVCDNQDACLSTPGASALPVTLASTQSSQILDNYCGGSPGVFAGEVSAAVNARSGLPLDGVSSLSPMTDAPMFGSLDCRKPADDQHDVENVLPPRRHADYLLDTYWRCIQPLELIVDKDSFLTSYQAVFVGGLPESEDERTFLASLNTVFAMATQVQENLQLEQRQKASNAYFHRAWTLLRPETIMWEPGSLAVVQCLLLMSRYLQCTNNPHQTWMAIGSAVRIAQSLGLHIHDSSLSGTPMPDTKRRQQLWKCCVFMDRSMSWAQGRTSTAHLYDCHTLIEPTHDDGYFTKVLELYEISNHITLSQMPSANSFEGCLGLPRLYRKEDFYANVIQLESCIERWQEALPKNLTPVFEPSNEDTPLNRQRTILHLRLLHTRIVLFRPLLARLCLSQSREPQNESKCRLRNSLVQDAASLCIQAAQHMINVVIESTKSDVIGILPWWHRIFYLHIAGTILIAAMLREDLWTSTTKRYWEIAMSAFRAHEDLSPFVKQCVENFQVLSSRVLEPQHSRASVPLNGMYFQDIFQDMGFDADSYLFGKEDMAWLGDLETFQ